ncbi:benzoquinone reductase [Amanita thiersii Skay4041]|uniref:Benzoquinone reductase n=1 Tax=Amanita thiersii Skay4041 TaxID=703135 RepID=A0A2A9NNU4_9AGAR|nr:benzoquinone reductase [Amanita thiersii Skay4041]
MTTMDPRKEKPEEAKVEIQEKPKEVKEGTIAIIIYSMYGHIARMAEEEAKGITDAGGEVDIYQVPETLSDTILEKMHAPPKEKYKMITLDQMVKYDAFLFGVPTRYGNMPGQWKALWDATGKFWTTGALAGKYAGVFVSTSSLGGGQEMTVANMMSTLVHHGMIFVPLGYSRTADLLGDMNEVHGVLEVDPGSLFLGSPWGAGTVVGVKPKDERPTPLELRIARIQGQLFCETVSRVKFKDRSSAAESRAQPQV